MSQNESFLYSSPPPDEENNGSGQFFYVPTVSSPFFPVCKVAPGNCKESAYHDCYDIIIQNCPECSETATAFFVLLVLLLGLAILGGNTLILVVYLYIKRKREGTKADTYRASLAVADLIAGNFVRGYNIL